MTRLTGAPESWTGEVVDGRADLYALGVILYFLLVGRWPFEADDTDALIRMHTTEPVPRPSELCTLLSPAVDDVMLRALAKRPGDRFDSGAALSEAVRAASRAAGVGPVFVPIAGASGAGKTTLMSALAGYHRPDHGALRVNGDDFYAHYESYRGVLGYVPQDDILHATLTVEAALTYTARLRMPADTTPTEISARIDRVLHEVEMSAHRKQRIVDLSGGQRERVSIAAELLADPSLFFLDEPTSGLDPGLEKKMMYTLRYLADSGRTVVLVTHATANITQCDLVVFMAEGKMVYYGPPAGALVLFGVTSGDFADIYTKLQGRAGDAEAMAHSELAAEYGQWVQDNQAARVPPTMAELWQRRYHNAEEFRTYVEARHENRREADSEASEIGLRAVAPGHIKVQSVMTLPSIYPVGSNKLVQVVDNAPCPDVVTLPAEITRDIHYAASQQIYVNKSTIACNVNMKLPQDSRSSFRIVCTYHLHVVCQLTYMLIKDRVLQINTQKVLISKLLLANTRMTIVAISVLIRIRR